MSEKEKIVLEYTINASPKILYTRLSTASGLSEWFADDVNIKKNVYTFMWDGSEQKAELIQKKPNYSVKFKWLEDSEGEVITGEDCCYFEFQLEKDELTGDIALLITDFVDEDDKDDAIELWDTQINELKRTLGV